MMGRLFFELPFSRTHELEADAIGVMLCAKACYNPAAAMKVIDYMSRALLSLCQFPMSEIVTPYQFLLGFPPGVPAHGEGGRWAGPGHVLCQHPPDVPGPTGQAREGGAAGQCDLRGQRLLGQVALGWGLGGQPSPP